MISQVQAEDADLLTLLIHHYSNTNHPLYFSILKSSFDAKNIREVFTERQRHYLLFSILSLVVILFLQLQASWNFFTDIIYILSRVCEWHKMDIALSTKSGFGAKQMLLSNSES